MLDIFSSYTKDCSDSWGRARNKCELDNLFTGGDQTIIAFVFQILWITLVLLALGYAMKYLTRYHWLSLIIKPAAWLLLLGFVIMIFISEDNVSKAIGVGGTIGFLFTITPEPIGFLGKLFSKKRKNISSNNSKRKK